MGCASRGTVRRDAAALNATLAAQGGCEDRLGSSPYSAREEQERARRMRGCISQLSSSFFSSPVRARPPGALLPRIPRRASASVAFTRLALASYSPFRASRKNLSSRSNSRTARKGDSAAGWRKETLKVKTNRVGHLYEVRFKD